MMRFQLVTYYENSRIDWAAQGIKAKPQSEAPSTFKTARWFSTSPQRVPNPRSQEATTMNEPKITVAEYYELKRLTERAADRQETMAGDRGGWTDAKLSTSLYVGDVSELDEYSRQLEAKGVTEEDIEWRAALLANPDFREPAPLGHIVVDDVDFDYEVSELEIDGPEIG